MKGDKNKPLFEFAGWWKKRRSDEVTTMR